MLSLEVAPSGQFNRDFLIYFSECRLKVSIIKNMSHDCTGRAESLRGDYLCRTQQTLNNNKQIYKTLTQLSSAYAEAEDLKLSPSWPSVLNSRGSEKVLHPTTKH